MISLHRVKVTATRCFASCGSMDGELGHSSHSADPTSAVQVLIFTDGEAG